MSPVISLQTHLRKPGSVQQGLDSQRLCRSWPRTTVFCLLCRCCACCRLCGANNIGVLVLLLRTAAAAAAPLTLGALLPAGGGCGYSSCCRPCCGPCSGVASGTLGVCRRQQLRDGSQPVRVAAQGRAGGRRGASCCGFQGLQQPWQEWPGSCNCFRQGWVAHSLQDMHSRTSQQVVCGTRCPASACRHWQGAHLGAEPHLHELRDGSFVNFAQTVLSTAVAACVPGVIRQLGHAQRSGSIGVSSAGRIRHES